ncbi:MAG: Do family serine endopeptidase [Robiginitomaculum sp.]|nr:Do family serine endopeptidase [Robiginitomaculum sp.]
MKNIFYSLIFVVLYSLPVAAQDLRVVPETQGQLQLSYAPLVKSAAPAVVNVFSKRTVKTNNAFRGSSMFDRMFGRGSFGPQERVQQSLGSGVIVADDGVIVTNYHVVRGADELRVVLADRREFKAELLLADQQTDLAVLRIDTDGEALPTMAFASSGVSEVGDLVLAIGNPFGVGQTVTSGIISALARTDVGATDFSYFIQTDAAINPGNSGGALVNMKGELLGINTVIVSRSGGSNGVGFSIPAAMVSRVVESAIAGGEVIRPWFGARLQNVDRDLSASLGLDRPLGTLVSEVYPGGAAEKAGIRRGDVVLAIGDQDINTEQGLRFRLAVHKIGEKVAVKIYRDGKHLTKKLKTIAAPESPKRNITDISGNNPFAGAKVGNISPALALEKGLDPFATGVVVLEVIRRSAAGYYGIRTGDIFVAVGDDQIDNVDDLTDALDYNEGSLRWPVKIVRAEREITATIRMRR